MDINSLAHTKWNCKYHCYLHQSIIETIYGQLKRDIANILSMLCKEKVQNCRNRSMPGSTYIC